LRVIVVVVQVVGRNESTNYGCACKCGVTIVMMMLLLWWRRGGSMILMLMMHMLG
jgi:hypothetical protein